MNIVDLNNVTKKYFINKNKEHQKVLDKVSLNIQKGEIIGFIGANGSGKSTTIRAILDLIRIESGKIEKNTKSIGYLPEKTKLYKDLTGREFLSFVSSLNTNSLKRSSVIDLLERLQIQNDQEKRIKNYSKGMIQKLGFVSALINDPELVILDEPLSGVDINAREIIKDIIKEFSKDGKSFFITSHNMQDIADLSNRIIKIVNGRIEFNGLAQEYFYDLNQTYRIKYLKENVVSEVVADESSLSESLQGLKEKKYKLLNVIKIERSIL